jgi:hypothetical protein
MPGPSDAAVAEPVDGTAVPDEVSVPADRLER